MSFRHLLLSGCFLALIHPAFAETKPANRPTDGTAITQPTTKPSFPEVGMQLSQTGAPPVLRHLMDSNVQLVSLGEVSPGSGVIGYLAEAQDNKFQTFYLMPDGTTLIAGLAFRLVNGSPQPTLENITARQVADMRQRLDSSRQTAEESRRRAVETAEMARKRAEEAAQSQRSRIEDLDDRTQQADAAIKQFERAAPLVLPPSLGQQNNAIAPVAPTVPASGPRADATLPATLQVPSVPSPQAAPTPAVNAALAKIPASSINPNDFMAALNNGKTQWFDLGPAAAPMLVMVADPRCPYCHKAWTKLAAMINDKQVRVRVVLIPASPASEADTISLLSKQGANEPGRSFWLGQGSADGKSIDPPPPLNSAQYAQGLEAARQNLSFVEKFNSVMKSTPFLAYVGSDDKLRTLDGIVNLDDFLQGLPTSPVATR